MDTDRGAAETPRCRCRGHRSIETSRRSSRHSRWKPKTDPSGRDSGGWERVLDNQRTDTSCAGNRAKTPTCAHPTNQWPEPGVTADVGLRPVPGIAGSTPAFGSRAGGFREAQSQPMRRAKKAAPRPRAAPTKSRARAPAPIMSQNAGPRFGAVGASGGCAATA